MDEKKKLHLSQTILIASALKIKAINNKQWWTMCFEWNSRKSDYFSYLNSCCWCTLFDVYLHSSRIAVGNSVFIIRQHLNFYHLKLNCDCVYFARFMCQLVGAVSHANLFSSIDILHAYVFYIKCFIICLFVRL